MITKYMHTLEGRPATYVKNSQVCFLSNGSVLSLCDSLAQIRREQKQSLKWRLKKNMSDRKEDYGCLRIKIRGAL